MTTNSARPRAVRITCLAGLGTLAALIATLAPGFPIVPRTLYVGVGSIQCDKPTIQEAIDIANSGDTIKISRTQNYFQQHFSVVGKNLAIIGATTCGQVVENALPSAMSSAATRVTIDGNGNGGQNVISISGGSKVTLVNLDISGGSAQNAGGGINFVGAGSLTLGNVSIHNNSALFGGGLSVNSQNSHVDVTMGDDVLIFSNTAGLEGGGIVAIGDVYLKWIGNNSTLALNSGLDLDGNGIYSPSYGGGLYVYGGKADIALTGIQPGLNFHISTAGIEGNAAAFGGGIGVAAGGRVRIFNIDPNRPTYVYDNTARNSGGGLFASGLTDPDGNIVFSSNMCVYAANLEHNHGPYGAAAFINAGSRLNFNTDPESVCDASSLAALGELQCTPGVACGLVYDNDSTNAAIELSRSILYANRVQFLSNTVKHLIDSYDFGLPSSISNCLIASNTTTSYLANFFTVQASINGCTIADNTIGGSAVIASDPNYPFFLSNSIIAQPGKPTLTTAGANVHVNYVDDSVDDTSIAASNTIIFGGANFAGGTDYHLVSNAPALDFAPAGAAGDADLDAQPRTVDLPNVVNHAPGGARDLGAYEYQIGNVHDRVFAADFEKI